MSVTLDQETNELIITVESQSVRKGIVTLQTPSDDPLFTLEVEPTSEYIVNYTATAKGLDAWESVPAWVASGYVAIGVKEDGSISSDNAVQTVLVDNSSDAALTIDTTGPVTFNATTGDVNVRWTFSYEVIHTIFVPNPTPTPTPSVTMTPTPTPTKTTTVTPTMTAAATRSVTPTPTNSATVTPTKTTTATVTPTITLTPTNTPTPTG